MNQQNKTDVFTGRVETSIFVWIESKVGISFRILDVSHMERVMPSPIYTIYHCLLGVVHSDTAIQLEQYIVTVRETLE